MRTPCGVHYRTGRGNVKEELRAASREEAPSCKAEEAASFKLRAASQDRKRLQASGSKPRTIDLESS